MACDNLMYVLAVSQLAKRFTKIQVRTLHYSSRVWMPNKLAVSLSVS